ncbi:hypothetical protein F5Y11DRAFT_350282 [Daldinia sp. FL1419]|nr:hypothetical protein F5Y11DRAFT_350282 [Daldinia sp. FL1419]
MCISFLGLNDSAPSANGPLAQVWPPQEETRFVAYAAIYFGYHYVGESKVSDPRDSDSLEEIPDLLLNFLNRLEYVQRDPDRGTTSGSLRILETLLDSPYDGLLLKWCDQRGETPFEATLRRNNIQAVDIILKKHSEHKFPGFYPTQPVSGVHLAARVASCSVVGLLLGHISDDYLQSPGSNSVLRYAAGGNKPENGLPASKVKSPLILWLTGG